MANGNKGKTKTSSIFMLEVKLKVLLNERIALETMRIIIVFHRRP